MLVSVVQQSESAICIHISPYPLPLKPPSHPPYPTPQLTWFQKQNIRAESIRNCCFGLEGHFDVVIWVELHQNVKNLGFFKQELEMYAIDFSKPHPTPGPKTVGME